MNIATQLGSYLRYIRMGMSRDALATICGLPLETIYQMDQYDPDISASTLLHLARGLSFGLCDVLRAMNISTAFAKSYDTVSNEDCFVFKQGNLRDLIDLTAKDGHSLKAPNSPAQQALSEAQEIDSRARQDPDYKTRLTPADLKRAYELGTALGKNDLRDYVEHLLRKNSRSDSEERFRLFSKRFGIPEASLYNLVGPLPVSSFTGVLQIDKDLALDGVLVSFAWKVSEDQLGVFLDDLEGDGRLTEPAQDWNEVQRESSEVLLSLDYQYRMVGDGYRSRDPMPFLWKQKTAQN